MRIADSHRTQDCCCIWTEGCTSHNRLRHKKTGATPQHSHPHSTRLHQVCECSEREVRCQTEQPTFVDSKAHNTTSRSVTGHQKGKHISCDRRQRWTCDTIALLRTQPDTKRSYQTWEQVEQRTARFCASVPSVQHLAVRESHFSPSWHKSSTASAQTYRLISDDQGNIKPLPVLQRVD